MRIELNCAVCGENSFNLEGGQSDDTRILCANCGHEIGTLQQLKERVAEEVMSRSRSARGS
jgi:hypothetical protein